MYCTALYCTILYCTVLYCTVLYLPGGGAALEGVADEVAALLQPEEGAGALVVLQRLLVDGPVLHPRPVTQQGAGLLQLGPPPRQPLPVVDVSVLVPGVGALQLAELGVVVVVEHHEHHQQRGQDRVGSAVSPVQLSTGLCETQCSEKAATRALSLLKAPNTAFTIENLLKDYMLIWH